MKQKNQQCQKRKNELFSLCFGLGLILLSLSCGLYFVPKAYASQALIKRKGAMIMEYIDISIFCVLGILIGTTILILSIKNIRNYKK
jgi:nitrate reductase gamma subunit